MKSINQLNHIIFTLNSSKIASAHNAGDPGLIPGLGKSPGGGYGNPLHYSCLQNPMDRGPWQATVHGVTESDTTERFHFLSSKMGSLLKSGLLLVLIRLWHLMQHGIENEAQQGLKKDFLTLAMASGLPRWR